MAVFAGLLQSAQGGKDLEAAKVELRDRLLPHCADELGAGQFCPADVKMLMEHLTGTVLNHYVLYQHVFTVPQERETHEQTLVVQRADLLKPLETAEQERVPEALGAEEAADCTEEVGGGGEGEGEEAGDDEEGAVAGEEGASPQSAEGAEDLSEEDAISIIIRQRLEQERQKLLAAQDSMQEEMLKKIEALQA